jgi:NADPH-dependent curcumin reductase CurA
MYYASGQGLRINSNRWLYQQMAITKAVPSYSTAWVIAKPSLGRYSTDCLISQNREVPQLLPEQVLLRTIYLSLDPTSRNWLKLQPSSTYFPLKVGDVMIGQAISRVEASSAADLAAGDIVVGLSGWETLSVVPAERIHKVLPDVPLETNLSIFSHIGLAAVTGLIEIAAVKAQDTVVVSAAAGATGVIAAQIAKAVGARVIGIAGGADKCRALLNDFGLDGAIDYKVANIEAELGRLCQHGVDVFFDNVGGAVLDAVLMNLARGARIAVCGQIALYNSTDPSDGQGVRNLMQLVFRTARMEGFVAGQMMDHAAKFEAYLLDLYRLGKIKAPVHIIKGIENAPQALDLLFSGTNRGKLIIEVSPAPTDAVRGRA